MAAERFYSPLTCRKSYGRILLTQALSDLVKFGTVLTSMSLDDSEMMYSAMLYGFAEEIKDSKQWY